MSIKNMFEIARSFQGDGAVNEGLKAFKNFLQVENGINKNWQDALTFDSSVNAINALNKFNAFNHEEGLKKAQGDAENVDMMANYAYDRANGRYRSGFDMARLAAPFLSNSYAVLGNSDYAQKQAEALANSLANFDPVASARVRTEAGLYGNYAPQVTQAKDGTTTIRNSSGYERVLTPLESNMWAQDANKFNTTQYGWGRDDAIATRDQTNRLAQMSHQADLNNRLNSDQQQRAHDYAIKQAEWELKANQQIAEQKHKWAMALEKLKREGKGGVNGGFTNEDKLRVMTSAMQFAEGDPQKAVGMYHLMLETMTNPNGSGNGMANFKSDAEMLKAIADQMQKNQPKQTPPPQNTGNVLNYFAPETRFGHYSGTLTSAETRAEELANLESAIKLLQAKYDHNVKLDPNAYLTRNQKEGLDSLNRRLNIVKSQTDEQYFTEENPIEARFNWFMFGNPMGNGNSNLKR